MSLLCGGTVFGHWAHLGSLMARLTILGINTCQEEEDMYQVWRTCHCRGYESVALVCDNMSMTLNLPTGVSDTVFLLKRQDNHDAVVMSLRCGCSRLWLDKKDKSYVCLSVDCRWMIHHSL